MSREFHPIAVSPHTGEMLEVGSPIHGAIGIIPERHRHARKRFGAHQLTRFLRHRLPLVVPHIDRHTQPAHLQLAAIHGPRGVTQRETAHDVRAATDAAEPNRRRNIPVHEVVAVFCQRAAGGEDAAQRAELHTRARSHAFLLQHREILGAGTKHRHPLGLGHPPQNGRIGASGAPSYSTTVAPSASPETSQFHIIHPQVVK